MTFVRAMAAYLSARTVLEAALAVPLSIAFTGLALAGIFTEPALLCPAVPVGVIALALVNALGRRWQVAQGIAEAEDLRAISERARRLP